MQKKKKKKTYIYNINKKYNSVICSASGKYLLNVFTVNFKVTLN